MKLIKIFLLAIVVSFSFSQEINAQFLKKLKQKIQQAAEETVIEKTAEKTAQETGKAMDSILFKNQKIETENKSTSNEILVDNNENNSSQRLKTWSKYNFIPGDKIIFEDNLTGEESGEFPSRWDLINGDAENASLGEVSIINIDNKSIISPLMENNQYLPDVFTIEFDAFFNEVIKANYYQEYNLRLWDGPGSNHENGIVFDPIKIFRHEVRFRIVKNNQVLDLGGSDASLDNKDPEWRHIAIAFNKRSLKIFIDQYRVLNIPHLGFKPKMFSIGAQSTQSKDDIIAIKNIRIAEGGKKLYDRVMAEGKFVTRGILFDTNKANIKPESMGVINEIAKMMQEHSELKFSIEGHTDSDGDESYNKNLSEKRAIAVKEALVNLGIESLRMETKGYGENVSVSDNTSPEGKANNRRVEFIII